MNRQKQRVGWGAFPAALWAALQWRLLLLWVVFMALPTAVATLPLGHALGERLDHLVNGSRLAQGFDALPMSDVIMSLARHGGPLVSAGQAAMLVTLLLAPFLTGMVVVAARPGRQVGMGALVHGGLGQYWRMVRLMLWGLIPFAIAIAVGMAAFHAASGHADVAVLQSSADHGYLAAKIVLAVLLVLAHAMLESARAQVAADDTLRSATRAFGRGLMLLLRRPLATLGLYLATSVVGYVLAALVVMWRVRTVAAGPAGLVLAVLLAQLVVVILAWQRIARLDALARLARVATTRRRAGGGSLAPAM